jgi:hypothetical protein
MSAALSELAPPPDFRYVGLEPAPRVQLGVAAALCGVAATLGMGAAFGFGSREAATMAIGAAVTTFALRRAGGPARARGAETHAVPMAIVPWGILIEPRQVARVLRWAAIERVVAQITYGNEPGTQESSWSVVTVETGRERLAGRAPGAVPLERLQAHVEAYAEEAAHAVALDLSGYVPGGGAGEPQIEPLLASARAYVASAPASSRLGLDGAGYRSMTARAPTARAVTELRAVLSDRAARAIDPRAFAAVVAAELGAKELLPGLLELTACPHPVIAAVARAAAQRLGANEARTGTVDEVAPFLGEDDVAALVEWAGA